MDNFSLKDVKMLIETKTITEANIKAIIESCNRNIYLYLDNKSLEILKYLKENVKLDNEQKSNIKYSIENFGKETVTDESDFDYSEKHGLMYIICGIVTLIVGIIIMIIEV